MNTDTPEKILLIQTASIGDVILITPVIEALHQQQPEAKIDVLVKKGIESLFAGHPFIEHILVWDKSRSKYRNLWNLLLIIRKKKYDRAFTFQRFLSSGFLVAFSRAKRKIGFKKNPLSFLFNDAIAHSFSKPGLIIHEVDRNLSLTHIENTSGKVVLYPTIEDYQKVMSYKSEPYICIAPASLWFTKQFPVEKWCEFLNNISKPYGVFFVGSKSDEALILQIIQGISNQHLKIMNLVGKLSFLQTAALMKDAVMNFVNDSAPMHLASSVNAKITAVFCSTIPLFGFGPLSEDSVIIETEEKLNCRPCGLHGHHHCPEKHFNCAYTIKKELLLERI